MSVDGINNLNKAEILKLAQAKNGKAIKSANKPEYLTRNGSIFNAHKNNRTNGANTQTGASTQTNLEKLAGQKNSQDMDSIGRNMSAGQGKSAAKEAQNESKNLQDQTSDLQAQGRNSETEGNQAKKTGQTLTKNKKSLEKQMQTQMKFYNTTQQSVEQLSGKMEDTFKSVDTDLKELQTLAQGDNTGVGKSSAFSLSLAGDNSNNGNQDSAINGQDPNQQRMQELQTGIETKLKLMDSQGKRVYTMQRTANKSLKAFNKTSNAYVKTVARTQRNLGAQQEANNGVIKVATKVNDISQTVATAGTALNYGGQGMVAAGEAIAATGWGSAVGAGMISAGGVMQKVGTTTEMIGNYGVMAASAVNTVAYAADGNFMGALMSAGSAAMSGTSAIKASKNFGKSMETINKSVEVAKQTGEAGAAARDQVKQAIESAGGDKAAALGGMSKKEAVKATQANMLDKGVGAADALSSAKDTFGELKGTITDKAQEAGRNLSDNAIRRQAGRAMKGASADKMNAFTKNALGEGAQRANLGQIMGAANMLAAGVNKLTPNQQEGSPYVRRPAPPVSSQRMAQLRRIQNNRFTNHR